MNVIIAGGGSVGFITAELYQREGYNVTIIEQDPRAVRMLQDRLDINVIQGTTSDLGLLHSAGIKQADLFLGLTDSDEANILAAAYAKQAGAKRSSVRLTEAFHLTADSQKALLGLGIDEIVDTEQSMVTEITRLMQFPGSADIKYFFDGEYAIAVFCFSQKSPYYGKPLKDIQIPVPVIPLGYTKVSDFKPYDPEEVINEFLYVYYACARKNVLALNQALQPESKPVTNLMIFGGGYKSQDTAIHLGLELRKKLQANVTLVSENEQVAQVMSEQSDLPVIFGDPSKPSFSHTEALRQQTAFIALSHTFEKNLFACSIAYREGVPYTVSLVRYPEHVNFVSTIPLTSFINPALVTANKILKSQQADNVITRTILNYNQVECIEYQVPDNNKWQGKSLGAVGFKKSQLITVKRDGAYIDDTNEYTLQAGDQILLLVLAQEQNVIRKLIA